MPQISTNLRLYTYETSAQFAAASGFLPEDVGKVVALVQETGVIYWLATQAPTWTAAGANVPAGSITATEIADDTITATQMASLGTSRELGGRDEGQAPVGFFYLTGAAGDTELVTINSRTYEFDDDATSTGDVDVDISADATADAACTALAAAINGDASRDVDAVVMAGNADTNAGVMLVGKAAGATNFTLTTDAANGVVSAATLTGASAAAVNSMWSHEYTVTAADVTQLATTGGNSVPILGVSSTTQPKICGLTMRTSAGAMVVPVATLVWTWLQANSNFWVLVVDDSAGTLASGDVIGVTAVVG